MAPTCESMAGELQEVVPVADSRKRGSADARRARVSGRRAAKARPERAGVAGARSSGVSPLPGLASSLVNVWREGIERGTTLDAEHAASTILGIIRSIRSQPGGLEPWRALCEALPAELVSMRDPDADGLLAAMSILSPDAELALRCADAIGEMSSAALVPSGFAHAQLVESHVAGDVFGDQSMVVAMFEHAGEPVHALVLLFDHCLQGTAGLVKDAWITPEHDRILATWNEQTGSDELAVPPRRIDARELALLLARGLDAFELYSNPPVSEDVGPLHALLRARLRELPQVDVTEPHPDDAEREQLARRFLDSDFAAMLDREVADEIVGQMLYYVADYADGKLVRWSPNVLGSCLMDWFPRKVLLTGGQRTVQQVPDIVRAWVRFAAAERGLPEHALAHMLEFIDEVIVHKFADAFASDAAVGPAKAMLRGLFADGVDITDQAAVRQWVDDVNALPLADRSRALGPQPANTATAPLTRKAPKASPRHARYRDVVQLKVTLRDTKPPVWRRVLVPASVTLAELHEILQAAMGWTNSHLHEFEVDGHRIGMSDLEDLEEPPADEIRYSLDSIAYEGRRFKYLYDFGDNWQHTILVEKILDPDSGMGAPVVTGGRRACPPEDVGGTRGFAEFLSAIADPMHDEHESLLEWTGGGYDATDAALDDFDERLAELRDAAEEPW